LVAAAAGGHHIFPAVGTCSGNWLYMVSGELDTGKLSGAIHANMAIAGKQCGVI
jgi:hypothetical protein